MAEQAAGPLRERAVKRLDEKRAFQTHLVAYVVVNTMLVLIWAFFRTPFFWPIVPIAIWGMGLVLHAYETYRFHGYTEADVRKEMARLSGETVPESKTGVES